MSQKDPLALAFFGVALALLAGLLLYVFLFFKAPEPATSARASGFLEQIRRQAAAVAERFQDKPAAKPTPATPAPPAQSASASSIEAGHVWRYAVVVEPPAWRDITLTYRTQREADGIGVLTDFLHAKGKMNFHLGIFAPAHPTHANTRFPGFFMYGAYLKQPLKVGDEVRFGWHWQGKSPGSVKRFEGQMNSWENVTVPGGTYRAALIEGMWSYLEDGEFRGRAYEKFWYAPQVSQIVKIMRSGIAPDEGSKQIVAELTEYR